MLTYAEKDGVETRVYEIQPGTYRYYKTEKQVIELFDHVEWKRMLFIDGQLQSTTRDEEIYHKHLVAGLEKKGVVCVIGGGEGATAREMLRCDGNGCSAQMTQVERLVMVDWDREFVNLMRGESWHQGAFSDRRLELRHEDCFEWVKRVKGVETFDTVIVDLLDPDFSNEESCRWWRRLVEGISQILKRTGRVAINCGRVCPWNHSQILRMEQFLLPFFPRSDWVMERSSKLIPSFRSEWGILTVRRRGAEE
jgi:spermidine synthase